LGNLKLSSKDNSHYLLLNLDKKEKYEEGIASTLRSSGFLTSIPLEYNDKKRAVRYDLSGLISLRVRLGSVITIDEFYLLIANLYRSILNLTGDLQIAPSFLDWNPDCIFVDVLGNIYFLVYPLHLKTVEGSGVFSLLRTLIKNAKPFQSVDEQGLLRLRGFLAAVERGESDTESFIYNLGLESLQYKQDNLTQYTSPQLKLILEGVESIEEERAPEVITEVVGGVELDLTSLDTEMIERTGLLSADGEDTDGFDEESTSVLDDDIQMSHKVGYLKRSNGDVFELDSRSGFDTWVFGKRPKFVDNVEVGFSLTDNKFISGTHFRIMYESEESTFYIEDLGSTNGTWLGQTKLTVRVPLKLEDGSIIKIAREEVHFKVKEV
jgi:hypothetical protein